MFIKTVWAALLLIPSLASPQGYAGRPMKAPHLPFFDWNVCPGEGCAYRQWTARSTVTVYNSWKPNRHDIAHLAKGDAVTGITGGVITYKPGVILLEGDLPADHLKRGDKILTYTYRGEGVAAVWLNDHYESNFDISFTRWPDGTGCGGGGHCVGKYVELGNKIWWAQVKLKSGRLGWVNMDASEFDGTCAY